MIIVGFGIYMYMLYKEVQVFQGDIDLMRAELDAFKIALGYTPGTPTLVVSAAATAPVTTASTSDIVAVKEKATSVKVVVEEDSDSARYADHLLSIGQRKQLEERFDVQRAFLRRLVDMQAHKNAQYQEVISTMSSEIMRQNDEIGRANGKIVALRQALFLSRNLRTCSIQAHADACRPFF